MNIDERMKELSKLSKEVLKEYEDLFDKKMLGYTDTEDTVPDNVVSLFGENK